MKNKPKFALLVAVALIYSGAMLKSGADSTRASEGAAVTVRFPDKSMGALSAILPNTNLSDGITFKQSRVKLGQAQGRLRVATGTRLWLDVNYHSAEDTSSFKTLSPDQLTGISLKNMPISDDGLANFEQLTGLRALNLQETDISDKGLKSVAKLKKLQTLNLSSSSVKSAGVSYLTSLTNLNALYLSRDNISDDSISALAKLPRLQILFLERCKLTDAIKPYISSCLQLRTLSIKDNKGITAQTIVSLNKLKNLKHLFIDNTGVKPGDYDCLRALPSLEGLQLDGPGFTKEVLAQWQKMLPHANVVLAAHRTMVPTEVFKPLH